MNVSSLPFVLLVTPISPGQCWVKGDNCEVADYVIVSILLSLLLTEFFIFSSVPFILFTEPSRLP